MIMPLQSQMEKRQRLGDTEHIAGVAHQLAADGGFASGTTRHIGLSEGLVEQGKGMIPI